MLKGVLVLNVNMVPRTAQIIGGLYVLAFALGLQNLY